MATSVVYVHIVETKTGEWCPVCLLPSAITIVSTMSTSRTEYRPGGPTMTTTWCTDCGWTHDDPGKLRRPPPRCP